MTSDDCTLAKIALPYRSTPFPARSFSRPTMVCFRVPKLTRPFSTTMLDGCAPRAPSSLHRRFPSASRRSPLRVRSQAESSILHDDVRRLRAARTLVTRTGRAQFMVMEDIWLGSLLYRGMTAKGPIRC